MYPVLLYFGMIATKGRTLRRFLIILGLLFASSIIIFVVENPKNSAIAYYFMLARFWELAAGCLAYFAHAHDLAPAPLQRWLRRVAPILFCGILATLLMPAVYLIWSTVAAVGLTGLVLISTVRTSKLYSLLACGRSPISASCPIRSIFLWHWSILCLSRYTVGISWQTAPFQIALMMVCSFLSYYYVERPIRNFRQIPVGLTTIFAGAAASCFAAGLCVVFLTNSNLLFLSAGNLVMPPAFPPVFGTSVPCVVDEIRPFTADKLDKCTIKPKDGRGITIWTSRDSHAGHLQGLLYTRSTNRRASACS